MTLPGTSPRRTYRDGTPGSPRGPAGIAINLSNPGYSRGGPTYTLWNAGLMRVGPVINFFYGGHHESRNPCGEPDGARGREGRDDPRGDPGAVRQGVRAELKSQLRKGRDERPKAPVRR